jgi:hypothetical protein
MNEYTVTLRLNNREQFINFIETVGPAVDRVVVTVQTDEQVAPPSTADSPMMHRAQTRQESRKRGPRGSKVNTTIIEALQAGPRTLKELKDALAAADLSPGSLSTGLAALQRSREVERIEDGLYGLTMRQAAE